MTDSETRSLPVSSANCWETSIRTWPGSLREVEGGWGNQMWRLGDELAVRIQRMEIRPCRQFKERRWLPLLAPRLPLPIPVPVRSGAPSAAFP